MWSRVLALARRRRAPPRPALVLTPDEEAYRDRNFADLFAFFDPQGRLSAQDIEQAKRTVWPEIAAVIVAARQAGQPIADYAAAKLAARQAQQQREQDLCRTGYVLTREDFESVLRPLLGAVSFMPNPTAPSPRPELADALWQAASRDRHAVAQAKECLIGTCDERAVIGWLQQLRSNYEALRCAQVAGLATVRALGDRRACPQCACMAGHSLAVAPLLTAYHTGTLSFPHELPGDDEVQWCPGPRLVALPTFGAPERLPTLDATRLT